MNLAWARVTYRFNGQRVAVRTSSTLNYLYADNLGGASLATSITGTKVSEQRYYPFGSVRWVSGTLPTDRTFTGQRSGSASNHVRGSNQISRFLFSGLFLP